MNLNIERIITGPIDCNSYVVYKEGSNTCFVVDPADFEAMQGDFQDRFELPLTAVGTFTSEWQGARVRGVAPKKAGYDHFAE